MMEGRNTNFDSIFFTLNYRVKGISNLMGVRLLQTREEI